VQNRYSRCIATALMSLIGRLDFTRANQAAGKSMASQPQRAESIREINEISDFYTNSAPVARLWLQLWP
jgi:hypothetical protein